MRWATGRGDPTVPGLQQMIRILGGIKPAELQEAMRGWVSDLLEILRVRQYVGSVDGKALRAGGKHVLSVFVHDVEQVVLTICRRKPIPQRWRTSPAISMASRTCSTGVGG